MRNLLKILAILATIWILLALIAGALVTKTGSGEGCGANWPLCHGKLIPENPTIETLIEYTHRLITGVAGLLVFLFTIICLSIYRKQKEVVLVSISSLFFLILQSALGAFAVLGIGRQSAVLALHFGFSLMSYASVFLLMVYVFQLKNKNSILPAPSVSKRFKINIVLLFVYTYIVVYIGAYVRHTGSSLGCEGWPLCNGQVLPELGGQVTIAFGHRVAALLLMIAYGVLVYQVVKHYSADKLLKSCSIAIFVLGLLQGISGGYMVLTDLHMVPSILHATFISLLFGILFYLTLYVFRKESSTSKLLK